MVELMEKRFVIFHILHIRVEVRVEMLGVVHFIIFVIFIVFLIFLGLFVVFIVVLVFVLIGEFLQSKMTLSLVQTWVGFE